MPLFDLPVYPRNTVRVYIAGPYRADDAAGVQRNVRAASEEGAELLAAGYVPFVPHTMTHGWEDRGDITDEQFLAMDIQWLEVCDAVLVLPGWEQSNGTLGEMAHAGALGLEVFFSRHDLLAAFPIEEASQ